MKKLSLFLAGSIAALSAATMSANAAYLPGGVQLNVSTSTVTGGGWSECYSANYGASGPSVASVLGGCSGSRLMLAAREVGSNTLSLLAQAGFSDVTFDTGTGNVTHNANGVEWYFNDSWSWGFAPGGATVNRNSCDIADSTSFGGDGSTRASRLCWHTRNALMTGGFRVGAADFLNGGNTGFEKVVFSFNAAVPEPASWALMIAGFGLVGSAMRRRKPSVSVRFA